MCQTCNHLTAADRIKGLLDRLNEGCLAGDRKVKPWPAPAERVASILEWVRVNEHITDGQLTALANIHKQHQKPAPPFKLGARRKRR